MRRVVFFDVNGTLTDPSAIGGLWERPELGEWVLGQAVRTAMVAALLGVEGQTFSDHLRAALEVVIAEVGLDLTQVGVEDALGVAAALPARPGAGEALSRLREAEVGLVALTNSGAQDGQRTLENAGLAQYFELILGVDAVNTFKPHPAVYTYALSQLGQERADAALAATHPWDLAGAAHAGMGTAWVRHGPRVWPAVFAAPGVQADSLPELAHRLLTHGF